MIREALLIGTGAALGALIRFAVLSVVGEELFPVALLDISACFLMGLLAPGPFGGAGVLGGFSTYSAFVGLAYNGVNVISLLFVTAVVLGCTAAWVAGDRTRQVIDLREQLGRWLHRQPTGSRESQDERDLGDKQ